MSPAPLPALARALPRRAARPLGRAWGRLAFGLDRGRRRRAEESLRRAFPDLDAPAVTRLARRAFAHRHAALAEAAALERLDPRRLCRRLRLAGWEHLEAAESGGRGVLLLAPRLGLWRLAVLAVGLYRGPVTLTGALAEDPLLGRLAARHERRLGQAALETAAAADAARRLEDGGRVAVLYGIGAPDPIDVAPHAGAPVVPVLALPEPGGRYRIVVREPIDPAPAGDPEALARRRCEAVDREVRRRPELAIWWS